MQKKTVENLKNMILESAPHVDPKIAEDWLENTIDVVAHDVDESGEVLSRANREDMIKRRVIFHIRRLSSIGGSDMSVLYMEYKDQFYPFDRDAASVIRSKLGLESPQPFVGDTERGTILEPMIRKKFLHSMRAYGLKPYDEGLDMLKTFLDKGGCPNHPWMHGLPDGLYIDKFRKVWLVDFKCPAQHSTVIEQYESPPIYYRAQLAQYKILLNKAGVKVDHTCLVPFSTKEMKPYVGEFEIPAQMEADVIAAGDLYWGMVLKNEFPKRPPSKDFQYIREVPETLRRMIGEYVLLKKMESLGKNGADNIKDRLLELAMMEGVEWKIEDRKTRMPGLDITHKMRESLNTKKILEDFRALGGNPDDEQYKVSQESTTVSVIRSKKSEHTHFIEEVQEIALGLIDAAEQDLSAIMEIDKADHTVSDPTESAVQNDGKKKMYHPVLDDSELNF